MLNVFLGRQPILNRKQNLVAYELLFRAGSGNSAHIINDVQASANVVINAYGQLGIQRVLGRQRGFINISRELLMSDTLLLLPARHVVLELLESISITEEVVQRCLELKRLGYRLALDDVTQVDDQIRSLLPIVNVVKVDVLALTDDEIENVIETLKNWRVTLLAEKVDNQARARACMAMGFELFQGYYFAKPEIVKGKQIEPAKLSLLELLALVTQDGEIDGVEQLLKRQPGLSYNLLRMVNSVAASLPHKIGSIRQAVMVLGYRQLQRWVQLLLFASNASDGGMSNALMQIAAVRGKLMESIAAIDRPDDRNYQDRAFMTGIMSLLDALFGIDIRQIVDKLQIPDEIIQALLYREGRFGQLLHLIEASEKGDGAQVGAILTELDFLDMPSLRQAELGALKWASHINQQASSTHK
ncbi:EAL and HDOD domain-containing protein [Nitrosomonas sp. ANs5]|uniref:EAL and HDOD domain-containing protein n=1 Tax=Nitrosomonas sp. ANs5 TaxID=3423941 RepID=UPI003D34E566